MKVTILVNTLNTVNAFIYSNHIPFFVRTVKDYPDIDIQFFTPYRMSIDTARNAAAKVAVESGSDYLMFIDDDVMIPPDTFKQLVETKKDIVAGLVIIRGLPFNVMAFKEMQSNPLQLGFYNELPLVEPCEEGHKNYNIKCDACQFTELEKFVECGAVGFSCCLINTDVIRAMEPPYFVTAVNQYTEDVYFCVKARELEPRPTIFMNTDIKCGHLLNAEPIEWGSRRKMTKHYEIVQNVQMDNINYIDKVLARIR